jgi:hypothetical protein
VAALRAASIDFSRPIAVIGSGLAAAVAVAATEARTLLAKRAWGRRKCCMIHAARRRRRRSMDRWIDRVVWAVAD